MNQTFKIEFDTTELEKRFSRVEDLLFNKSNIQIIKYENAD